MIPSPGRICKAHSPHESLRYPRVYPLVSPVNKNVFKVGVRGHPFLSNKVFTSTPSRRQPEVVTTGGPGRAGGVGGWMSPW